MANRFGQIRLTFVVAGGQLRFTVSTRAFTIESQLAACHFSKCLYKLPEAVIVNITIPAVW